MKKLILMVLSLFLISLASATSYTDTLNATTSADTITAGNDLGISFYVNQTFNLVSINKFNSQGSVSAVKIKTENGTLISSQSLSGDTATFNELLEYGKKYRIECTIATTSARRTTLNMPKLYNTITLTNSSINGADNGNNGYYCIESLTYEVEETSSSSTGLRKCFMNDTNRYLTINFKNETIGQEVTEAKISSLSFDYLINNQTTPITYTYSSSYANSEYYFCYNSSNDNLTVDSEVSYYNDLSPQRTVAKTLNLNSTTQTDTYYLLPSDLGIDVTFQVISPSESPIQNAVINSTRTGYGIIEQELTDGAGSATFFISPNAQYNICAYYYGYNPYCTSITPTQSSYTIQLGLAETNTSVNYNDGISYLIIPYNFTLFSDNDYDFIFDITSSYYVLDEYGFVLKTINGSILGTVSGSSSGGSSVSLSANTYNYSQIIMDYYWIIGGNYTNLTRSWFVFSSEGTEYSLKNFADRIKFYIGNTSDSDGIFGLTSTPDNNFGMAIFVFMVIFIGTGIIIYRYGSANPAVVMSIMTCFIFIFDVGLGLIPKFNENMINNFPTLLALALTIVLIFREEMI